MRVSGAQAIVECLKEQGVDIVFGYPGGTILPLYDALYNTALQHVLTAHEQGAAHAADGYARASGRVGVCIATGGPGATNLVTGLATAYLDSVPVVAITGQVPSQLVGADAFQEVDTTGITMPITKHNFLVKDASLLPDIVRLAFKIAQSGRPGPVLIDVPRDVQTQKVEFTPAGLKETAPTSLSRHITEGISKAVDAIVAARKPVIVVGGGVITAGAAAEVKALAEKGGFPVVSTLMGLGGFSGAHPQFLGLTGMHGAKTANYAVNAADVLIAIGSRFSDRVTGNRTKYAADKTVLHIDVDPAEVDKNVDAHIALVGKVKEVLTVLTDQLPPGDYSQWWETINAWRRQFRATYEEDCLNAPWMMHKIAELTAGEPCVFVTDVGQHQMWAAQHLQIEAPRTWLTSGGLGTMGFGLPAAVGAQLAQPDKRVIHIAGDGGFKMTCAEFFTAASHGLPLISIIVDNGCLGMVRQWQQLFYQERYSSTVFTQSMDYAAFGRAFGVEAVVVSTPAEFLTAFKTAIAVRKPYLIAVKIPSKDMSVPMVKPNASLDTYLNL